MPYEKQMAYRSIRSGNPHLYRQCLRLECPGQTYYGANGLHIEADDLDFFFSYFIFSWAIFLDIYFRFRITINK